MLVDTLWPLIFRASMLGILLAVVAYLVGLALHRAGRSTRVTSGLMALGLGWVLGTNITLAVGQLQAIPSIGSTVDATTALLAGIVVSIVLGATRRRRAAGWFLVGLTLPWTILFAGYLIELVQGEAVAGFANVAAFLAGAVPLVIGLVLAIRREDDVPDPLGPAGRPGSRRTGSLTAVLMQRGRYGIVGPGFVLSLVVAAAVTTLLRDVPLAGQILLVAGGVLLATELERRSVSPEVRRAIDAYHWIGQAAIRRLEQVSGRRMPRSRPAMERWLAEPETPMDLAFRPEFLAYLGRPDEARSVLGRVPADAPVERFYRSTTAWELEWRQVREPPPIDFPALIESIGPVDDADRLVAEGTDAWRRSEVALAAMDPRWMDPLVAFQARLGGRARVIHGTQWRRDLMVNGALATALFLLSRTAPG